MDRIWDESFYPIYKYTYWTFMSPFALSTKSKLGYLTTFILLTCEVRTFIFFLILSEKEIFFEATYTFWSFTMLTLKSIICLWNKKKLEKCFQNMNGFIKKSKTDPINDKNFFINLWKSSKIFLTAKWIYKGTFTFLFFFLFSAYYRVFIRPECVTRPFTAYYSPYFSYNLYTKWAYTIFDTITCFFVTCHLIYNEILVVTFLHFLHSQFLYLKLSLDKIFDDEKVNDEIVKWWIQNYCSVISLGKEVNNILASLLGVNYLSMTVQIVLSFLSLTEVSAVQTPYQKMTAVVIFTELLILLGYQCQIVENINALNEKMYENLYKFEMIHKNKTGSTYLKMITLMSQRPVRFKGFGFINLNNKTYNDLLFRTYSFYSSMVSIKK